LSLLPIVTDETRADWEDFVSKNTNWLTEGLEYQAKNGIGQLEGEPSTASTPVVFPEITTINDVYGNVMTEQGVSKDG